MTPKEIVKELRLRSMEPSGELYLSAAALIERLQAENAVAWEELRETMLVAGYAEANAEHWLAEFRKRAAERLKETACKNDRSL